jgi:predicted dehydrogenase
VSTIGVGVVGLGYWGPNLARNFDRLPDADLRWICDFSDERRGRWAPSFPTARVTAELDDLLSDPETDAVVLATPVPTHAELAVRVLEAGKHCFVEKPLAQSSADAERIVEVAETADRVLMVGHLLEYHPGVQKLRELVTEGSLGEIRYLYSNRLNLGQLRADENALWSLGAHDVSVVLGLIDEDPVDCRAVGESYMRSGVEDVVFGYLRFPSGVAAHLHLSWLDPHKERRFTVVGSQQMATFDDMAASQKVKVYDKGFDQSFESYGEYIARSGDVMSPHISNEEPLRIECRHFLERVGDGGEPRSGARRGLRVVRVLEALQESLDRSSRAAAL